MDADAYRLAVARDMSEAVFQGKVIDLARGLGWKHYHPPRNKPDPKDRRIRNVVSGWPDLVLVHREQARILFRELKRQREKPREDQEEWLELLRIACHADEAADVWRPLDLLEGRIERDLTRPRIHAL